MRHLAVVLILAIYSACSVSAEAQAQTAKGIETWDKDYALRVPDDPNNKPEKDFPFTCPLCGSDATSRST
jgi:hypothetical protein